MRATPFGLVFGAIAGEKFPTIAAALERSGETATDRDRFVLLEPVGRLLRDIVPEDAGADALEAHALLLHHAYRHWSSGGGVYRIGESALRRAFGSSEISSRLSQAAFYLQLPELRVWGTPTPDGSSEPLDGIFVTQTPAPDGIAVLGIFGMRPDRPGFSAVGVEGRADTEEPRGGELEVAAARADGSAPFSPMLAGGTAAGLHSLANAGELLLLTCRLVPLLPRDAGGNANPRDPALEHVVPVE
jgi:hypothetical protein